MFKKASLLVPVLLTLVAICVQPASAGQKDPDVTLDPSSLNTVVTQLLAPAGTIGDTDTNPVGVGFDAVGINDSLTNPPRDPADDSPGNTFFVDNTPTDGDCPATPYTTIQAAVDASGPGDTVKVCPGTYPEQVRINGHNHDGLKLEGLVPLQAFIQWPSPETAPLALVDFQNSDHVTLRGFTIVGPFTFGGCSPDRHEGVLVDTAFDEHIHHNHITFIKNSLAALRGCQEGDAVAIGHRNFSGAGSAHVDHNQIDDYQKNGIQAVNQGTVLEADHNVVTGSTDPDQRTRIASNGFSMFNHAIVNVHHNVVSQNQYVGQFSTGIIVDETPSGSSRVDHNRVFQNDYGIEASSEIGVEISHNDIVNNRNDAVWLCADPTQQCGPISNAVVRGNDIENNGGAGIFLNHAHANLIKSNEVVGNGPSAFGDSDGVHADATSDGNLITNNHASNNVTFDCHDESVGTGTAGTANTWQNDHGSTSSPPGICPTN